MTTENKKDQIAVRVNAATFEAIQREADSEFCKISEVVRSRLEALYATGPADALEKSPGALARERRIEIDNELKEIELATKRKETLTVDQVLEFVSKELGIIRSRLLAIPQTVMGLNPDQTAELKKAVQDCMTDLTGDQREVWDDMAGQ